MRAICRKRAALLLVALAVARPIAAQQATALPERLMIGPEEYVRGPRPFPINLNATSTRLDSLRAENLAPRQWGMANAKLCRAISLADTVGWQRDGTLLLPAGFARDSSFRSYHGGLKWRGKDAALIVENGWYGVAYDSSN